MHKTIISILSGVAIGSAASFFLCDRNSIKKAKDNTPASGVNVNPDAIRYPLKATLYKFEINDGTEKQFTEWMKWHYDEYSAIIETLEREKMYSEAIFTDTVNQPGVLYWLTIDGVGGASVANSPLKIDTVHNQYMKEVIKKGSRVTLKTEYYLIPEFLKKSIAEHQMTEK